MTALTSSDPYNAKRGTNPLTDVYDVGVKANTKCYAGGIAVMDTTGYCAPGSTGLALIALGWFEKDADNSTAVTGGAAGAINGRIVPGTRFAGNSGGADAIAVTNIGQDCFIVDDQTVALTDGGGTRSRAGKIEAFDATLSKPVSVQIANTGPAPTPKIQTGTGTFAAGVLTVNTGISVTASTRMTAHRINGAGTQGDEIRVPSADRTVGIPGVGAMTFRSFLNGAAATSDTSTFEYVLIG